ncbi:MAG: ion transporter [Bacteroidia bacterium]|nr:ion transporter [Bacteroidia bacterium]
MGKVSATLLNNKRKKENDAGFGALNSARLINKNGTANVNRVGVPFSQQFSLYHYLIGISWLHFLGLIFAFYFAANLFFASIYIAIGVEQLSGANIQSCGLLFWDAFFFSAQTLSTVGYGHIAPIGFGANVVSSIEALFGLLVFALITGLGYGRFAKADASLIVSNNMLISPYLDGQGLMFRFGNARNEHLIEAEVEMMFSYIPQNKENTGSRAFIKLKLERSKISIFTQSWTVVHPIDEDSPLKEMNTNDMENSDAEVIVFFKAFDEKFNQTVHRRFSFTHHEIVWNAKFTSVLSLDAKSGNIQVDFGKINEFEMMK